MKKQQITFIIVFIGLFCVLIMTAMIGCKEKQHGINQSQHLNETSAPIWEGENSILQSTDPQEYLTFDLSDYQSLIDSYISNKNVGDITTKEEAILQAQAIWRQEFGELIKSSSVSIETDDCVVRYDEHNNCWLINGSIKEGENAMLDAVPCALIKKDGTVLAIWF